MRVFACLRPRRTERSGVGDVCDALFRHEEVFAHILEVMPEARMLADNAWLGCDGSMRKRRIVKLGTFKTFNGYLDLYQMYRSRFFASESGKLRTNTITSRVLSFVQGSLIQTPVASINVPLIIRSLCSPINSNDPA
jgi:hypothetical protein